MTARPSSLLRGGVIPLLGFAIFINYVDRGILPTAAPLMKDELHLSAGQIGVLLSAFFWTYTPCQLLSGWLAERVGPFRTLGAGVAIWSLATAAFGVAHGFSVLIALRLVLGVGESAAFACASKLFATRLPPDRLGMANGVITLGLSLGPAFGAFAGGMLMAGTGWRPVFIVFGLASLLWLAPWTAAGRSATKESRAASLLSTPPLRAVLRKRDLWGCGLGHFAGNYTLYFVISWLPLFLVKTRGFSMAEMASLSGAIYLVYAASGWISGWATDRWIASGAGATLARKTFLIGGNLVTAAGMAVCAVAHGPVVIATLFVIGASFGLVSPNLFAVGQTLAGPRASGIWIGAQNSLGNTAGIIGPLLTGMLIDRTHAWGWAFAATAVAALLGVIGWAFIVRRVEPVDWDA